MNNTIAESTLARPDGRTLAYATGGNASSTTVLLYLHGAFTVGETSDMSRILTSKNIHHVRPTLPGWGNTSPPPPNTSYVDCLTSDMTALLDHLYRSRGRDIQLYVAGGSYGTVPAQILYGAPYDKFPYGRCIAGVLLMGALSPFRYHTDYAKHMLFSDYLLVGPLSQWTMVKYVAVPLVASVMGRKLSSVEAAEKFMRGHLFDAMDEEEKKVYAEWRAKQGIEEGETERRLAVNAVRSVAKTWEGFRLMSEVLHTDWGYRPDALDEAHSRPFVMLISGSQDKQALPEFSAYLAECYKNSKHKNLSSGHIGLLCYLDDIWAEFLAGVE